MKSAIDPMKGRRNYDYSQGFQEGNNYLQVQKLLLVE
ncbi:MAG: hypothetical protein FD164_1636 [Nitrospirae bacterium]|nr:MAG: hypothetical protein FD164_1636 [Nitrospirota bacterium]